MAFEDRVAPERQVPDLLSSLKFRNNQQEVVNMVMPLDLTGARQGRLVALQRVGSDKKGQATWLCKCDCGNEHVVVGTKLKNGYVNSCGCLVAEKNRARLLKHGQASRGANTRLYTIWRHMKERCFSPNSNDYKNWGGRGITVCDEWLEYLPFEEWATTHGYCENLTIDRIDVNGDYEPSNCRWADKLTQANNTRTNHLFTFGERTQTIAEWSRETGVHRTTILNRINKGYKGKDVLTNKNLKTGKNLF